jgi:hypothetical protein
VQLLAPEHLTTQQQAPQCACSHTQTQPCAARCTCVWVCGHPGLPQASHPQVPAPHTAISATRQQQRHGTTPSWTRSPLRQPAGAAAHPLLLLLLQMTAVVLLEACLCIPAGCCCCSSSGSSGAPALGAAAAAAGTPAESLPHTLAAA